VSCCCRCSCLCVSFFSFGMPGTGHPCMLASCPTCRQMHGTCMPLRGEGYGSETTVCAHHGEEELVGPRKPRPLSN
jgi:hypothetical protein